MAFLSTAEGVEPEDVGAEGMEDDEAVTFKDKTVLSGELRSQSDW